MSVIISHIADT